MLPIRRKTLYHPPFLNFHRMRALGITIHQGLISKSMKYRKLEEKGTKNMVATSEMKNKFETMLEMIRGLMLNFVLYFVTV